MSAAVDAETQTAERITELAVRLTYEDTRRSQMNHARALVVASVLGCGTDFEDKIGPMCDPMETFQFYFTTLVRDGLRPAC